MFEKLGIKSDFLGEVVKPGTSLGFISIFLQKELGIKPIPAYAVCCHDTASAVFAVPSSGDDWLYISSGTWSLFGIETFSPIVNKKSFGFNFTNEGGYRGTIRFLKNIMGLWILQECRKQWQEEGSEFSYVQLAETARNAEPFFSFIDVNYADFIFPGKMVNKVADFCRKMFYRT